MEMISCDPVLTEFSINGKDLSGALITQTEYSYQLVPHHLKHKTYFIVYSDTLFSTVTDASIKFKAEVRFNFDTNGEKPEIVWLTGMVKTANALMNKMLALEIEEKTNLNPFTIYPVTKEDLLAVEEILEKVYSDK